MESEFFFVLSALVILGKLADFIIHVQPDQLPSPIPLQMDAQMSDHVECQTRSYYDYLLAANEAFVFHMFKGKYIKGMGFVNCFLVTAFFVQGTILFSTFLSGGTWTAVPHPIFGVFGWLSLWQRLYLQISVQTSYQ